MTHTVLVTGVSRHLGARVASVLAADPDIDRVIGVDTVPPPSLTRDGGISLGRTEFVRVDLRSPDIAKVIAAADVDTVVHLSLVSAPSRGTGRAAMKEHNVIGTMQLLGACQRSATVRRVVVRSTTAVYGSSPHDPAVFTEDTEPHDGAQPRLRQGRRRGRGLRARLRAAPPRRDACRCCGSPTSWGPASTRR